MLYKDKNYEKETEFIESIFEKFGKPTKILEVGCGTGNYTKLFIDRGYKITGLDISGKMIDAARKKCDCNFLLGDMANFSINEKFDACLALFSVMGYVTENSDIVKALSNIRSHLVSNGLLIFDVWNGLAVMHTLPEPRVKEVKEATIRILRIAFPQLNAFNHTVKVDYKLLVLNENDNTFTELEETHLVRFYFPQEIKFMLEQLGFEVLRICPFLDLLGKVDENIWNMTIISKLK